jgi:hypothetical protein
MKTDGILQTQPWLLEKLLQVHLPDKCEKMFFKNYILKYLEGILLGFTHNSLQYQT